MWQTVVLIPKGEIGDFRGIGLVEVMRKIVSILLNRRLATAINRHAVLHGFRAGRRTGTAALESKLLQHLTAMREAVLFEVFLDLQKACDALDQDICLEIIVAYGVGPRIIRLLWTYWDHLTMVARSGGYFGLPFKGYRGLTQGDPLSPTLFSMVVEVVIRHWVTVMVPTADGLEGLDL